jgi:hypothetical protein
MPLIPDKYWLEHLLLPHIDPRTGRRKAGFETVADCQAEDCRRASDLRATAAAVRRGKLPARSRGGIDIDPRAALELADRLEAGAETLIPPRTQASSLFMREERLEKIGRLLEVAEQNRHLPTATFSLVHPAWAYPAAWLPAADPPKNQLRTHLNRADITQAQGFLVAHLHGEFEPTSQEYQLHYHGVCVGEKLVALNRLRNKQGYVRTSDIYRPIKVSAVNEKDAPRQLSYVIQSFWPGKVRLPDGRRARSKRRIREPYQSLYLLWLDRWTMTDLTLLNGFRW